MNNSLKIAQISDTHLFSDKNELHCGANVHQNLIDVLKHITLVEKPDAIIFTGDLTQDHSDASYREFVNIFRQLNIQTPVHFIAGNHDEFSQLESYLTGAPFNSEKELVNEHWQVLLINSKSETPAGYVAQNTLNTLANSVYSNKKQLVMMHHHAIDVGYSIDKHGLKNKDMFWSTLNNIPSISILACGHVHNDIVILPEHSGHKVPLYTCPATSIQFDKTQNSSSCNGQGAGYRIFELCADQTFTTHTHFLGVKTPINDTSEKNNA